MEQKEFLALLKRYSEGTCSEEEKIKVESWYNAQKGEYPAPGIGDGDKDLSIVETNVMEAIRPRVRRMWPQYAAAAMLLVCLSVALYLYNNQRAIHKPTKTEQLTDVEPGGNRAVLTLANGQKVVLTGAKNGRIAAESQAVVNKTADGKVVYEGSNGTEKKIVWNTLTTPKGGRYDLVLADGTEVTLDANSSITYPVAFVGKERKVKLIGQAYFTVVHNAKQQFVVEAGKAMIKDIGTQFNVSNYADDRAIRTTLIEGAVAVNDKKLIPGQQAALVNNKLNIKEVDTDLVVAWKENRFLFRNESLQDAMSDIARWYDVEVVYENAPENARIGGGIPRDRKLSEVLRMLERTKLAKFKIQGRKVTVTRY